MFQPTSNPTVSISEASEMLALSKGMIRHLIEIGWLDGVVVGGVVQVRLNSVGCLFTLKDLPPPAAAAPAQLRYRPFASRRSSLASRIRR
jgi:hypothetical protein